MRGRHGRGGRDLKKRVDLESLTEALSSPVSARQEDAVVSSPCGGRKSYHGTSPQYSRKKESPLKQTTPESAEGEPRCSQHLEEMLLLTPENGSSHVVMDSASFSPEISVDKVDHREELLGLAQVYARIILGELTI